MPANNQADGPRAERLAALKEAVCEANLRLWKAGLVLLTWGNVSGLDPDLGCFAIKPSGVPYEALRPEDMVVMDLEGNVLEGKRPSTDAPTHRALYRALGEIGGVAHTHSTWAVAYAQAGLGLPAYGTTHADHFYGKIPCTRSLTPWEIAQDYEYNTGLVIAEAFSGKDASRVPGVLVKQHGPFTWGPGPAEAAANAIVLEEVAKMAAMTRMLNPGVKKIGQPLLEKHFLRKHGPGAYYGQK
jgi:L-ribulose-5-phosphate 4-epimerase